MTHAVLSNVMLLKVGWFVALFTILTAGVGVALSTQKQINKNNIVLTQTLAKIAVSDQDWKSAKEWNLELLKHNPENKSALFNLGLARHYLGEYEQARQDWNHSLRLGGEPGIIYYNLACSYARENNTEQVLKCIQKSKDEGFNVKEYSESDPDLAEMRKSHAFMQIVKSNRTKSD
ncbi:MAG: tetratricopeptide repeat protein [Fimbriimonadaceae bacterium]